MADSPYPSLSEFQSAHRKLLCEYISAIDVASSLPVFVNLTNLLVQHKNETMWEKLNRQNWFLLSPLTWKPFVKFLVEEHIKVKMASLSIAYNQLSLRLPEGRKYDPFRTALKSAVTECHQLGDTLITWKNGKTLLAGTIPVAVGWLTSWLGTDNLLSAIPQLGIEISENLLSGPFGNFLHIVVWFSISLVLLFALFNQAFEAKRAIFLPEWASGKVDVKTHNIYASEDALYKLIGRHKTPEFPLDLAALIFFCSFILAFFVLRAYYFSSSIIFANLLAFPVEIALIIWAIASSRRRWR